MGKVKKFRKKYKALCKQNDESQTIENKSRKLNDEHEAMEVDNSEKFSTARSTFSISKSIKSSLGGRSITKKDKHKIKHEVFLERLDASKKMMESMKKGRKKQKIVLPDDLPALDTFTLTDRVDLLKSKQLKRKHDTAGSLNSNSETTENSKVNKKNRKGFSKRHNIEVIQSVNQFTQLLKKKQMRDKKNL